MMNAGYFDVAKEVLTACVDLFWPPHCAVCGTSSGHSMLCDRCLEQLPSVGGVCCEVCSRPFPGAGGEEGIVCPGCRDRRFHFVCSVSPLRAWGPVRDMVHRLKYRNERWLARVLAGRMVGCTSDSRLPWGEISALVPVPLHPIRERERGYNQAELLARRLGAAAGKPVVRALRRVRATETQTRFDRDERMRNLRNAFTVRHNARVESEKLILIDDVFTTGSTLDECARALLAGGAASVWAMTAARA